MGWLLVRDNLAPLFSSCQLHFLCWLIWVLGRRPCRGHKPEAEKVP